MDKTGFLDTIFFVLTKKVKKTTVTFGLVFLCMLLSISGDISFVVMIPLSALLFKYGKRNPLVGIITAFSALCLGYSINIFLNSIESSLIEYTEGAARMVVSGYAVSSYCYLFIMILALIIGSIIITVITEKITVYKLGKYEATEETEIVEVKEKLTRREVRGLIFALAGAIAAIVAR